VAEKLIQMDWRTQVVRLILLTVGPLLGAVAINVFLTPASIATGGISGLAIILNHVFATPIGLVVLLGNIPIQILAWRLLGGWRVVAKTVYVVLISALAIDLTAPYLAGVTDDTLLNALFGAILSGIGGGLIYRAGGTYGGTSTLARILQTRLGTSMSSTYLYTDSLVVLLAGLVMGWTGALYAMIVIFVDGAAADYVLEGPSRIRTATIVTQQPDLVAQVLMQQLERGVTAWQGRGMYTGQERAVLFVTVRRHQVNDLRHLVFSIDPQSFIVIGQGHMAYGEGFQAPGVRRPALSVAPEPEVR
jgi:uncharacterized membrane-anchored protein YitT (DUF2179 family)